MCLSMKLRLKRLSNLKGIAYKYESFHKVKYKDRILQYIISSSNFLANRKLPDKAIDILDEARFGVR